jgi:hypothetical protein
MYSNGDILLKDNLETNENHAYTDEYIIEHQKQILRSMKEEMFEYYKKNHNLNIYYYQNDDPDYRKKLDKWTKKFYERLNTNNAEKKTTEEDVKGE